MIYTGASCSLYFPFVDWLLCGPVKNRKIYGSSSPTPIPPPASNPQRVPLGLPRRLLQHRVLVHGPRLSGAGHQDDAPRSHVPLREAHPRSGEQTHLHRPARQQQGRLGGPPVARRERHRLARAAPPVPLDRRHGFLEELRGPPPRLRDEGLPRRPRGGRRVLHQSGDALPRRGQEDLCDWRTDNRRLTGSDVVRPAAKRERCSATGQSQP